MGKQTEALGLFFSPFYLRVTIGLLSSSLLFGHAREENMKINKENNEINKQKMLFSTIESFSEMNNKFFCNSRSHLALTTPTFVYRK